MDRRAFLRLGGQLALSPSILQFCRGNRPSPVIDGMGEIRLDYPEELIREILASGMNAVMITLGNPAVAEPDAWKDALGEADAYDHHIGKHPSLFLLARQTSDIHLAQSEGKLALLYYLQNATPLESDLDRLEKLAERGVRSIQLTYNGQNRLGSGCLAEDLGLTAFGAEAVERMNALKLLVDLSHCGERTTREGIRRSTQPVSINHSSCRTVFNHPRSKSDEVIRELADRGGVIGIFQISPYLSSRERSTLDDFLDHILHAVKVAGTDHVGIGSDREHRVIPDTPEEKAKLEEELSRLSPAARQGIRWPFFISDLNHPRRMETVREGLGQRGLKSNEIDKLLGGNFLRLYSEVFG